MTRRSCRSACLAIAAFFVLSSCTEEPVKTNVLLITLDTTRADRLGCYGYDGAATPALDNLAADGVRYEFALTPVPITLPSHLSILSGMHPLYHGVHENAGFYVPDDITTLAEIVQTHGWRTAAFVGAFPLDSQTGLDQGFELYDDAYPSSMAQGKAPVLGGFYDERPAVDVSRVALSWLDEHGEEPFFAWVHYFDPHQPHIPPSPYRERFAGSLYDGEIASMDEAIGRILALLRERGILDRTLVVVVGDHGEALGEHGEPTHALLLYSSTLRVPLILRDPANLGGRVISTPVETTDIMPTILDRLELSVPPQVQGRRLPLHDTADVESRPLVSETLFGALFYGWSSLERLTLDPWTVIDGAVPRLYRTDRDPNEISNLAANEPDQLEMMLARLAEEREKLSNGGFQHQSRVTSAETRARLEALGYLGTGRATISADSARGPDPESKMPVFSLINEAQSAMRNRNYSLAAAILAKALNEDPGNPTVKRYLASVRIGQERPAEAISLLRSILEGNPEDSNAHLLLAHLLQQTDRPTEALDHLEKAVVLDARNLRAQLALAYQLDDLGRSAEAENRYRTIIETEPDNHLALNACATMVYRNGRRDEAVELLDRVTAAQPYFAPGHLNRAVIALDNGDDRKALALATRASALRPGYAQAFEVAALANEKLQRDDDAIDAWRQASETAPTEEAAERARTAIRRLTSTGNHVPR